MQQIKLQFAIAMQRDSAEWKKKSKAKTNSKLTIEANTFDSPNGPLENSTSNPFESKVIGVGHELPNPNSARELRQSFGEVVIVQWQNAF